MFNPKEFIIQVAGIHDLNVDVHTGVENKNGRKDPALLQLFVNNAHKAFLKLTATPAV